MTEGGGRRSRGGASGARRNRGQRRSGYPLDPAVLRMIPLALAIRHGLRGSGIAVSRPRYRVRGWNGELASPVQDLRAVIDETVARFGAIPVVLIGHSMGARAAFRVAGHPAVTAVAGLAPWLPPAEPVEQLAGRRVLLAHGTADRITSPAETWAYAERARSGDRGGHDRGARRRAHHAATRRAVASAGGRVQPSGTGTAGRRADGGRGGLSRCGRGTAPRVSDGAARTGGLLSGGARQAFAANGTRTVIVSGNQRAPPGCCGAPQTVCRYLIGGPNPSRASSAGNP